MPSAKPAMVDQHPDLAVDETRHGGIGAAAVERRAEPEQEAAEHGRRR